MCSPLVLRSQPCHCKFLCEITSQTICLRAELFTIAASLLLSHEFPSSAGLVFVWEDTWSSFEDLPPFPLPPDLYFHVTRQGLLIWKRDFTTVLWRDSFIPGIMSAFVGRASGCFILSCSCTNLLTFTLTVYPFSLPCGWTCSIVSLLSLSFPTHPIQGLCSPALQKYPEPQVRLWWTVPRKKARDVLLDAYRLPKIYFWKFTCQSRK